MFAEGSLSTDCYRANLETHNIVQSPSATAAKYFLTTAFSQQTYFHFRRDNSLRDSCNVRVDKQKQKKCQSRVHTCV